MKILNILMLGAALAAIPLFGAQLETINIDQVYTVDSLGDGSLMVKMTLNGAQFQQWQSKYGQNQSLLKRDLNPYVSRFEASDWQMQVNQMDRIVTITCKIKGAVMHRGGGQFEFRVPKTWRGGERHDSTFSFNFVEPVGPGTVSQNNIKLVLPDGASGYADDKSETGDRVIRYHQSVGGTGWLLWAGVALLVLGTGTLGFAYLGIK